MPTVIDHAGKPPGAAAVKAAGHVGAIRYLSGDRTKGSLPGKPIHRAEVDDYRAHGLGLAFVWQYGKDTAGSPPDVLRGRDGGAADARAAQAQLESVGMPDHPVFFAVDFDITLNQWNSTAVHYFRAAAEVLGVERVGIYGHSRVCNWAGPEDKVIGRRGAKWLAWQTRSWSGGVEGADYCVLFQRIVDTATTPGPRIGGTVVDVNDVWSDDWGQNPVTFTEPPAGRDIMHFDEYLSLRQDRWTKGRGGHKIEYVTRHHMGGIGDGAQCVKWWQDREASAHAAVDRDGKRSQIIAPQDTAWSNKNSTSNYKSYSIEHSNSGGPNEGWPIADATIREGAHLAAEVCISEGLGRPEFGRNVRDHCEFTGTECPYHLRNGHKYHDAWMKYAQDHYDNLTGGFLMGLNDAEQRELLAKTRDIHRELTQKYPSRSAYRAGDGNVDTLAGFILNVDGRIHESWVHDRAAEEGISPQSYATRINGGTK